MSMMNLAAGSEIDFGAAWGRAAEPSRVNIELERFALTLSHDLREPLWMVAGYAQLLADRNRAQLDEESRRFLESIADGADRMQEMLDGLMEFARVCGSDVPRAEVSATAALDGAAANLRAAIEASGATLRHGELPTVRAEPIHLLQIFQNLIGNAIKYRSEATPEIDIWCESHPGEWRFAVGDNGIGIDPGQAARIFQVFYQIHRNTGGAGVGLAICQRLVERNGGRIWASAKPEGGSIFYFTVPRMENTSS